MNIGGGDIATTTGLCVLKGGVFTPSSFKPRAKRPGMLAKNEIDPAHEGRVAREFRDHLRTWLVVEEIEAFAIEKPLVSNTTRRRPVINTSTAWAGQAITYQETGSTTMAVVFRHYGLQMEALELCDRLNIAVYWLPNGDWRDAFMGVRRAPKGITGDDARKWLKAAARTQCAKLGITVTNDDMADAVGVCWTLKQMLDPENTVRPGDLFYPAAVPA